MTRRHNRKDRIEWTQEYAATFVARRKLRARAHNLVHRAIQCGTLPPPYTLKCTLCPLMGEVYHHTDGYTGPAALKVIPLCISCHNIVHSYPKVADLLK